MKKGIIRTLALALALVMIAAVVCSCGDKEEKDGIHNAIENQLIVELAYIEVSSGRDVLYSGHTANATPIGNGEYSVSGTVTVMEGSVKYTASYSGKATYDSSSDKYSVDINLGNFR